MKNKWPIGLGIVAFCHFIVAIIVILVPDAEADSREFANDSRLEGREAMREMRENKKQIRHNNNEKAESQNSSHSKWTLAPAWDLGSPVGTYTGKDSKKLNANRAPSSLKIQGVRVLEHPRNETPIWKRAPYSSGSDKNVP